MLRYGGSLVAGDLSIEIHEEAGEESTHRLYSRRELRVMRGGEQLGLSRDGEGRLQPEELAFGGAIELSLLARRISSVSLGDVLGHEHRRHHGVLGDRFDLAAIGVSQRSDDVGAKADRFLPHTKIAKAQAHGAEHAALPDTSTIKNARGVSGVRRSAFERILPGCLP
jgi:hypothetical protein